ncbi:carbohydrate sulfotransferase 9-like [Mercenaria mercenaria]|uniref:carbohydrate sulfotransferase 9-like n=1 Tax=Mercenaria mercenaria TaxID=6596 RepID=UPI00234E7AF2|nr:carbohydrate sulfotransferase 9-like [Mercenaria mercenaria]XP_045177073.2 carbohydrate sulfotransferase 9-like [Mercenaria mercenaria]
MPLLTKLRHQLALMLIALASLFVIGGRFTAPVHFFRIQKPAYVLVGYTSSLSFRQTTSFNSTLKTPIPATERWKNESTKYIKTNGEMNADKTRSSCKKFQSFQQKIQFTVRWNENKTLLLCPIYKVGTTFWRRVFMIDSEKKFSHLVNPYEISFDTEYAATKFVWNPRIKSKPYKVMFTRDPYNRLFSFYVDKLLAPNPYFWKTVGVKIAALTRGVRGRTRKDICGHDITFPEFIKYVIHTLETRRDVDPHWVEMERSCYPCEMEYDFVGKMENFQEDSIDILKKLGLTKMASFLEKNGKEVSDIDAIGDTLNQPFAFRKQYGRCISFKEAILRSWRKLQIRGLIENDTLNITLINDSALTLSGIIAIAKELRKSSTAPGRKQIKNAMYKAIWSNVSLSDLYKLQELYAKDFNLFGYDNMPTTIFP